MNAKEIAERVKAIYGTNSEPYKLAQAYLDLLANFERVSESGESGQGHLECIVELEALKEKKNSRGNDEH